MKKRRVIFAKLGAQIARNAICNECVDLSMD